jgi:prepilin-type N-terminal cleavage/methylation domain-containing protein
MMRARDEHGFTLIELLVTMALALVVFGATLTMLDVFQGNNRRDQLRNETQDNARNTADNVTRQLRNVVAPTATYFGALEKAEPYSVVFQTVDASRTPPTENPANAMRVRYCLNDSTPTNEILWKQEQRWTTKSAPELPSAVTCPDLVAGHWEKSTQVVQHVTNRIGGQGGPEEPKRWVFVYGPAGASEVAQIVSMETNLYVDLNPGQKPGESQITGGVSLRNANRQPKAAFTATQQGAFHHVFLNASESSDADGLALTYKWRDNSAELNTTAQQYETGELVAGSKHTFKLTVTNPGGLENTIEKEVTVK